MFDLPHTKKDYGKNVRMVGAYMPHHMADMVDLLALYNNKTRSGKLRDIIANHVENVEPKDSVLRIMAQRLYSNWQSRKNENRGKKNWRTEQDFQARFKEFQYEIKLNLYKRKMSESLAELIIQAMEKEYGVS